MANKKEVVEEIQEPKTNESVEETTKVVEEPKIRIKKGVKKLVDETPSVIKVDLSKQKVDEPKAETKDKVVEEVKEEVKEEQPKEEVVEETPVLEEITNEEPAPETITKDVPSEKEVVDAVVEKQSKGKELPENIQKVVNFMDETGGSLEDYVSLNTDYSGLNNESLLKEYYKKTKSHLDDSEIDFLIQDSFSIDEDVDDERQIKKKKIAIKEQVASAKSHLDGLKSKYYEEIKAGSKLLPEQQKAVEFFSRYTKEADENQKVADVQLSTFQQKTDEVFNDSFKGFEYNIGEKKFRFNVKNADEVKGTQSSIDNFVKKFLDKKNTLSDAKGYHKSIFTAMNSDAIANHFYEQGKADAIKDSVAKSKNVSMDPRQSHANAIQSGGIKVRAIPGKTAADFKFKIKK